MHISRCHRCHHELVEISCERWVESNWALSGLFEEFRKGEEEFRVDPNDPLRYDLVKSNYGRPKRSFPRAHEITHQEEVFCPECGTVLWWVFRRDNRQPLQTVENGQHQIYLQLDIVCLMRAIL